MKIYITGPQSIKTILHMSPTKDMWDLFQSTKQMLERDTGNETTSILDILDDWSLVRELLIKGKDAEQVIEKLELASMVQCDALYVIANDPECPVLNKHLKVAEALRMPVYRNIKDVEVNPCPKDFDSLFV